MFHSPAPPPLDRCWGFGVCSHRRCGGAVHVGKVQPKSDARARCGCAQPHARRGPRGVTCGCCLDGDWTRGVCAGACAAAVMGAASAPGKRLTTSVLGRQKDTRRYHTPGGRCYSHTPQTESLEEVHCETLRVQSHLSSACSLDARALEFLHDCEDAWRIPLRGAARRFRRHSRTHAPLTGHGCHRRQVSV